MEITHTIDELRDHVRRARSAELTVGLVPTMGALHAGHMSLIEGARANNGFVAVSIFVNPTQFGVGEDYDTYVRDLAGDSEKCRTAGVDVVFAPGVDEMYPDEFGTYVETDGMSSVLEGASRPGHFRGVTTVVTKLLNIVQPDRAYFGMKDYQQLLIIRKMVRDLNVDVEIVGMPTVRESDGLALSSRNAYLRPNERQAATLLYRCLETARERVADGLRDSAKLRSRLEDMIAEEPLATLDYVAVSDPETLEPRADITGTVFVALAVEIGSTRLIDNTLISV